MRSLFVACVVIVLSGVSVPSVLAVTPDPVMTAAYLRVNYAFVRAADAQAARVERALHALQSRIGGECPNAAQGSPQDPESTQLSNELIGDMVLSADLIDRGAARVYLAAVGALHWRDASVERAIRAYAGQVRSMLRLAPPHLCENVRAWAAGGYHALAPATVAFASTFMSAWVAPGDLPDALSRYENAGERPLITRTRNLEYVFAELETREETTWWNTMDTLDLWP